VPVTEVLEHELARISALSTPNQVLAIVKIPEPQPVPEELTGFVVALDGIQDPGNLGTIIRTCDWFGVHAIFCSEDCADLYNNKVIQATMGSFMRVNLFYTPLAGLLLRQKNTPVYAAMLNGEPVSGIKKTEKGILVIGNESRGIRPDLQPFCTHQISIEKKGGAESLNAAVACGILLSVLT
jgi:RNA methyltransferase, TrmH family